MREIIRGVYVNHSGYVSKHVDAQLHLRNRLFVLRTGEAKDTPTSLDWPWAFRTPFVLVATKKCGLLLCCEGKFEVAVYGANTASYTFLGIPRNYAHAQTVCTRPIFLGLGTRLNTNMIIALLMPL